MKAITIAADGSITVEFTLDDRRALERVLTGSPELITLWRYLRTTD